MRTQEELNRVLELHKKWLNGEYGGVRADLRGVDLSEADLYGANLDEVNLSGANLTGAKNYYSFVAYDTSKRLVHCVKHKDAWMIQTGCYCFWGTLEELETKVKETHNSKVYLANIEILKGLR